MLYLVTTEEFENTYKSDWEVEYSSSFVSGSNVSYPLRWDYEGNRVIFSQSIDYPCNPILTFESDEEKEIWLWDSGSREYYNWMDEVERLQQDEADADPYGMGPFPEEMDSIGEPAPMPIGYTSSFIEI